MISLKKITINNIRSFSTEQTVDFTRYGKLIQVNGVNLDSEGSSGAGKSTVFIALDYLLGISDIPATVLQNRNTKSPILVSGEFDVDGRQVVITRGKKEGLSLVIGGEEIAGNVKLAEEKLDELIGMPRKVFKKIVHKKQKEGGFFLNLTAKETYDFLIQILGLDVYIQKSDAIDEDIKQKQLSLSNLELKQQQLESSIQESQDQLKNQETPPKPDVKKEEVETLQNTLKALEYRIVLQKEEQKSIEKSLKDELEELVSSFKKPEKKTLQPEKTQEIQAEIQEIDSSLDKIKALKKDMNSEISASSNALSGIERAKKDMQRIALSAKQVKEQRDLLLQSQCPTCNQKWVGSEADLKINQYNEEIEKHKKELLSLKDVIAQESEYLESIDLNKDKLSKLEKVESEKTNNKYELSNKITTLQQILENEYLKELNEWQTRIQQEKDKYNEKMSLEIKNIQNSIDHLNTESHQIREKVATGIRVLEVYEVELKNYNNNVKNIEQQVATKRQELNSVNSQIKELSNDIAVANEAKRLIKTYILHTFEDTLDLIGTMATDILSSVPNTSNITVYFESCKETKTGKLKDEVNAVVNMSGVDGIPIKSFSGGERTSIDLAVDLAVIDIIESKTGKGANFFIIDEPFDGLDAICKENYLEILTALDTNKHIVIVDHSAELTEFVPDRITVQKQNGESVIVS